MLPSFFPTSPVKCRANNGKVFWGVYIVKYFSFIIVYIPQMGLIHDFIRNYLDENFFKLEMACWGREGIQIKVSGCSFMQFGGCVRREEVVAHFLGG